MRRLVTRRLSPMPGSNVPSVEDTVQGGVYARGDAVE